MQFVRICFEILIRVAWVKQLNININIKYNLVRIKEALLLTERIINSFVLQQLQLGSGTTQTICFSVSSSQKKNKQS